MSVPNVCPAHIGSFSDSDLSATFPNGIAVIDANFAPDPTTKKLNVAALTSYIITLQQASPPAIPRYPMINPGTGQIDIDGQNTADAAFLMKVQNEYCFYEQRYKDALNKFLTKAVSTVGADNVKAQTVYLPKAESLNVKLNSILQILELLNSTRIKSLTNDLQPTILTLNSQIASTSDTIQTQYALLNSKDAIIETQNQMMIYTKEKNENVMNQIALFTIMNAFAIGGIYAIWRISK